MFDKEKHRLVHNPHSCPAISALTQYMGGETESGVASFYPKLSWSVMIYFNMSVKSVLSK